jgi:hypothetical protein
MCDLHAYLLYLRKGFMNSMRKLFKYPAVAPSCLITFAVALRIFLAVQGWPVTNGDEAMMNLASLHISEGRDFPVFFYGQHYLGTLEAYIGALLFRAFGPSVIVMRIEMVGFYAAFLVALYILVKQIYSRVFALVILALFAPGSPVFLALQGIAVGYPELPLLASLPLLVAFALARDSVPEYPLPKKALLYAFWGILAGIALWVHVLTGPCLLMAFSLMLLWQFKDMLRVGLWAILAGVAVGTAPLIWYNLHAGPGQDTLTNVLQMTELGQSAVYDFWQHVLNTLFVSITGITGFSSHCLAESFSEGIAGNYPWPTYHLHCSVVQAMWGLGFVALMVLAISMAVIGWRRYRGDRSEMVRQSARLFLLLAAALTLVLYIHGGAPVYMDLGGSRYLICLWVSVPAVLWPLWRLSWHPARIAVFTLLFVVLAHGVVMAIDDIPNAQVENAQMQELASYLEKQHITRFYSEYWTCNRLIFYSQEKLICGNTAVDVAHNRLVHGIDRYQPYHQAILKARAFVYPSEDITSGVIEHYLKKDNIKYNVHEVAGCTVIVADETLAF